MNESTQDGVALTWPGHLIFHVSMWAAFLGPFESFLFFSPYPALYHCVVFFWVWHAPSSVLSFSVLFAAVCHDTLYGHILGTTFLEILAFCYVAHLYRPILQGHPFVVQWIVCAMTAAVLCGVFGLLYTALTGETYALSRFLYSCAWVAASYPCLAFTLTALSGSPTSRISSCTQASLP